MKTTLPRQQSSPKKYILFLEDHEKFGGVDYVSAMLSHIEQNDFIHSVSGLIFGNYSNYLNQDLSLPKTDLKRWLYECDNSSSSYLLTSISCTNLTLSFTIY